MTKGEANFEIHVRYEAISNCNKLIEDCLFKDPDKIQQYGQRIVEHAFRISELCQKWDIPTNPWGW